MTGDIMLRRETLPDGSFGVVIMHADPEARISEDFVGQTVMNPLNPNHLVFTERTVRFVGCNRTLVYLIDWDDYDPATRSYGIRRPSPRRAS